MKPAKINLPILFVFGISLFILVLQMMIIQIIPQLKMRFKTI